MISFDAAVAHIRQAARPLRTERVAIAQAAGRVLAAPVVARVDSPRCDVAAMDGYAVRSADLVGARRELHVVGTSYPGEAWSGAIKAGQCVRIFTGSPVPNGADRIVIQEQVSRDGDMASVDIAFGESTYIRRRGDDFAKDACLLAAGRLIDPRGIVAAAAADQWHVEAFARPRVAILATGDELVDPGEASDSTFAVPDSVSPGVAAMVALWGGETVRQMRLRDDLPAMECAAREMISIADCVVIAGGASVGERDYAKAMFAPVGLKPVFTKVAIKPGKPAWLGRAGKTLLIGLPGNPTSAMVTARLFLAPLLAGLAGRDPEAVLGWKQATLATPLGECGARETFHRARLGPSGAEILGFQDSSAQHALAEADVLVRQPSHSPALPAGSKVEILDF